MKHERPQRKSPQTVNDPWPLTCELCTGAGYTQERFQNVRGIEFDGEYHKVPVCATVKLFVECKMCDGHGTIEQ